MKKIIVLLLASIMVVFAFASCGSKDKPAEKSESNDNSFKLDYTFDGSTGALTVTGNGYMSDYNGDKTAPWKEKKDQVRSVTISDGITSVSKSAFSGYSNLESVTIPASVKTIDENAFALCPSLKTVNIEKGLEVIGKYAFSQCTSLESIVLPEGVTEIGESAFYGCSSLSEITVPKTVTTVGQYVCAECPALSVINYGGTAEDYTKIDLAPNNDNLRNVMINTTEAE